MYTVTFSDNSIFKGGDLIHTKWCDIPTKPIKKIECTLLGHTRILEGYQAYNYFMEKKTVFKGGGCVARNIPMAVFLMGKKEDQVDIWIFDIKENRVNTVMFNKKSGTEFRNKPSTGWKNGI